MDLGYANQSSELGVTINSNQTDGYAIRTDSDTKRGYENLTSNAYYKQKFSSSDIAMRYWRSEGKVEYLDFFLSPLDQDYLNESTAFEINNVISDQFKSKILLSHIKDDIKQNQSTDYVTSKRNVFDAQLDFSIEKHNIAAGIYISDEEAASFAWGSGYTEDTRSEEFFIQDSIIEGKHRVFIATRYIDHETFGDEIVWNAEYGFDLNDRISFSGSSGSGFRAPDATDRFGFGGNINLLPEESNDIQIDSENQLRNCCKRLRKKSIKYARFGGEDLRKEIEKLIIEIEEYKNLSTQPMKKKEKGKEKKGILDDDDYFMNQVIKEQKMYQIKQAIKQKKKNWHQKNLQLKKNSSSMLKKN